MATNYVADGATVDYVAGSAIASGDLVVIGELVGVANDAIANGATGVVHVQGVFSVPKEAGLAVTQGDILYCDATGGELDKTNTGTQAGKAYADAAGGDSTVKVILNV